MSGNLRGFSVEGWFDHEVIELSKKANSNSLNMTDQKRKNLFQVLSDSVRGILRAGADTYTLSDGRMVQLSGDTAYLLDGDKKVKLGDGDYPIDGDTNESIKVSEGVAEVVETEVKLGASFGAASEEAITALVTEERTRESILEELATATGATVEEVEAILAGSTGCPTQELIDQMAGVLELKPTHLNPQQWKMVVSTRKKPKTKATVKEMKLKCLPMISVLSRNAEGEPKQSKPIYSQKRGDQIAPFQN